MGEMRADLGEQDRMTVTDSDTGARWVFLVQTDGDGRRHLGDPQEVTEGIYEPGHLRQACEVAKFEAIRAGLVEY